MKISCNLYNQWISAIRQDLSRAGFNHSRLCDRDCAVRWMAWKRRTVPDGLRTILRVKGFKCPPSLQQGLTELENSFIMGKDIWRWQTTRIDKPELNYEDGLFNDWGVHHFHLGIGYKNGTPYIKRTDPLLFALIDSSTVYEIGIYNHGEWYQHDILEIIDSNWPNLLDRFTLHGVCGSSYPQNNEGVKMLREGNVNYIITLHSGRVVVPPGGGYATNGISVEAVKIADYEATLLKNAERDIFAYIEEQVQIGAMERKDYDVRLHFTDDKASAIVDKNIVFIIWEKP